MKPRDGPRAERAFATASLRKFCRKESLSLRSAYFGARLAGAVSAVTMKRCYAVFLLLVATYFLFAPQGIAKIKAGPKPEVLQESGE